MQHDGDGGGWGGGRGGGGEGGADLSPNAAMFLSASA